MHHRGRAGRHQAEVDVVVLVHGGRLVLRIEQPQSIHHTRGWTKDRIDSLNRINSLEPKEANYRHPCGSLQIK
jgi:hypothetical protein